MSSSEYRNLFWARRTGFNAGLLAGLVPFVVYLGLRVYGDGETLAYLDQNKWAASLVGALMLGWMQLIRYFAVTRHDPDKRVILA